MPWLSLPEYARTTGTPESTVRAAIRAGKLRAELEQRAPGDPRTVWRVWYDDPQEQPQDDPQPAAMSTEPSSAPEVGPSAVAALVDALAAERAERQILSVELRNLTERAARAEAALEAAEARAEQAVIDFGEQFERAVRAEAEVERLRRRRWWTFWR